MSIPNPLHPLLPHFCDQCGAAIAPMMMASDGQVEEKPASGPPRPIETVRQWDHPPFPNPNERCNRDSTPIFLPPQEIPGQCESCGRDGYISRGVVERDVETGDIYRRDGKAVPRERT